MRREHAFEESLAWPVNTPPAVVLERVRHRAAILRRRRRMAVAGVSLPAAAAAFVIAMIVPGAVERPTTVKIRPAVDRDVSGPREGKEAGVVPNVETAPHTPSGPADPAVAPWADPQLLPGPFMPSTHVGNSLGRLVLERAGALVVVEPDGSGERMVAPASAGLTQPDWAPDGSRLTALHPTRRVVVVDMDGHYRFVSPIGQLASDPKWSPDGTRILYQVQASSLSAPTRNWLWSVRPDGADARQVAAGTFADWSPDGSSIAYNCAGILGVCIAKADGTGERVVSTQHTTPVWSPDGTRLAAKKAMNGMDWVTISIDGADERAVEGINPAVVQWSADGAWLVFAHTESSCPVGCSRSTIRAVRPDGSGARQVTAGPNDTFVSVLPILAG